MRGKHSFALPPDFSADKTATCARSWSLENEVDRTDRMDERRREGTRVEVTQ